MVSGLDSENNYKDGENDEKGCEKDGKGRQRCVCGLGVGGNL